MNITAKTKIILIIGDPVSHSLSPQIHNAAYQALRIDQEYVHIAARVSPDDIAQIIPSMKALGIRGLTCTIPHKTSILSYLDWIDPVAMKIGAVNSIVNDAGVVKGYNTDWIGIARPLQKKIDLKHKTVAIIGAGGASRAMIYACVTQGANITVYNRTVEKAEKLAEEFTIRFQGMDHLEEVSSADILINATSIGMTPESHLTPVPKQFLSSRQIVFDAVYTPFETQLLKDAATAGATVIHGTEMLLEEAYAKFKLYTGFEAPEEIMRKELFSTLGIL